MPRRRLVALGADVTAPAAGRVGAGVEMDALVEEKVFGSVWSGTHLMQGVVTRAIRYDGGYLHRSTLVEYSTDIASAWRVVEKMRETGYHFRIANWEDGSWRSDFGFGCPMAEAATAPLAICLAALAATTPPSGRADEKGETL
jgi:hypothetical protein